MDIYSKIYECLECSRIDDDGVTLHLLPEPCFCDPYGKISVLDYLLKFKKVSVCQKDRRRLSEGKEIFKPKLQKALGEFMLKYYFKVNHNP